MNIQKLENIFSLNFKSSSFTQLADLYFKNRQYDYALKVCRIGLKNDTNNLLGKYILAKIYLVKGDFVKAETVLQEILLAFPAHLPSMLLLVHLMEQLKRSKATIKKHIKYCIIYYPTNSEIERYHKKYCIINKVTNNKKTSSTTQKSKKQSERKSSFVLHDKLVTKTMYQLLFKQKKYLEAYELLFYMKKKKKNIKFVKNELSIIKQKLLKE